MVPFDCTKILCVLRKRCWNFKVSRWQRNGWSISEENFGYLRETTVNPEESSACWQLMGYSLFKIARVLSTQEAIPISAKVSAAPFRMLKA